MLLQILHLPPVAIFIAHAVHTKKQPQGSELCVTTAPSFLHPLFMQTTGASGSCFCSFPSLSILLHFLFAVSLLLSKSNKLVHVCCRQSWLREELFFEYSKV